MIRRALVFVLLCGLGVALSLMLGGCSGLEERPQLTGEKVSVITLSRAWDAREQCGKHLSAPPGWRIEACASFNDSICRITMRPDASDDTLGHETRHCFDGAWHR